MPEARVFVDPLVKLSVGLQVPLQGAWMEPNQYLLLLEPQVFVAPFVSRTVYVCPERVPMLQTFVS